MPNLTGAELAMQLLKIRPETPIILCTGYSSAISEDRAKAIGIRAFVMKPVDKKVLAHTIRQVLDGDASASELQG
jgi:DNA-binding NarL/FixJ family response regulator